MRFNHTDPARGVLRIIRRDAAGSRHILDGPGGVALCGAELAADEREWHTHVFANTTCPRCWWRHVRQVYGLSDVPLRIGGTQ